MVSNTLLKHVNPHFSATLNLSLEGGLPVAMPPFCVTHLPCLSCVLVCIMGPHLPCLTCVLVCDVGPALPLFCRVPYPALVQAGCGCLAELQDPGHPDGPQAIAPSSPCQGGAGAQAHVVASTLDPNPLGA